MRKSQYIQFMKAKGYVQTDSLKKSEVEILDLEFPPMDGYLYFKKDKKKDKK